MSRRNRRGGRRAALRAAEVLLVNEVLKEAKRPDGTTPLSEAKRLMVERYEPLTRDPAVIARLANTCLECGEVGHRARNCPTVECFQCKEMGHTYRDCPKRST